MLNYERVFNEIHGCSDRYIYDQSCVILDPDEEFLLPYSQGQISRVASLFRSADNFNTTMMYYTMWSGGLGDHVAYAAKLSTGMYVFGIYMLEKAETNIGYYYTVPDVVISDYRELTKWMRIRADEGDFSLSYRMFSLVIQHENRIRYADIDNLAYKLENLLSYGGPDI